MQEPLVVLLTFYCLILCANVLISFMLWRATQEKLYKWTVLVWTFSLGHFILQDCFLEKGSLMIASYGTYIFVLWGFARLANDIYDLKIKEKKWLLGMGMGIASGLIAWAFTENFFVSSMIVSATLGIPQFLLSWRIFQARKPVKIATAFFCVLLVINGASSLSYPFLRLDPQGALWGYSVTFFILVMFSIFVPAFIVKQLSARYQAELEEKVYIRTQELRLLSEQNSTLLSIVCHDLATPLTVLQVASGFLTKKNFRDKSDEEIHKYQQKIDRAMNMIREILQQVRSLQQIRVGKEPVELRSHDPAEMVREAMQLFEDQIVSKNIRFEFENVLPLGTTFRFDRNLMKNQVITNLLSNAIKFSQAGAVIKIFLHDHQGQGTIEIVDQGIGIPADILPHLFDFSAKTSRPGTQNETGTGFGLPLVKTSLELMGGQIEVSTNTQTEGGNSGTTFRLRLKKSA